MTAKRKILLSMWGQSIGRSYARGALGIKCKTTFTKAIQDLRNDGLVDVSGACRRGWEYGLTDAGKDVVRGWM